MRYQKTIAKEGQISGVGLHTGAVSTVFFRPGAAGQGIRFFKSGKAISQTPSQSQRCTALGEGDGQVLTVEHVMAAAAGLGISNLVIDVHGPELPGLDGSALDFVKIFKKLGVIAQPEKENVYRLKEPVFCHEGLKAISAYPAENFSVSYTLDYDHPLLKNQTVEFEIKPETFESEIAPARTFCTEKEAKEVRARGLGLGATTENTLVIAERGPLENTFRMNHECAVHKVLDLVGDLALLGFPISARIVALRSGHSLNQKLVEVIQKQKEGL